MSLGSAWLAQPDEKQAQQLVDTVPGMAHFAGTGPTGKICRGCVFWQDLTDDGKWKRDRCEKYRQLTQRVGEKIPAGTKACKYFESKRKA